MSTISIVIPCFQAEKYIERCLSSIVQQTYRDFDLILVNDCSIDSTFDKAKDLLKNQKIHVHFIENQVNKGPSLSRKAGIDLSDSEYIAFCDSDDWLEPDFVESLILASDNRKNDVVFCNFKSVYSFGKIVKHDIVNPISDLPKKQIIARAFDSLWCMMVRKRIIQSIDFPDIRNGEDMAIIPVIIALSESFGFVDKYLYNYSYHPGTLSKQYTSTMIDALKTSFQYIQKKIGLNYPDETEFLGVRNYLYGSLLNLFKGPFDVSKAKSILNDFEVEYPNWDKIPFFNTLPFHKRFYLKAAKRRLFIFCRLMSKLHSVVSQ